MQKQPTNWASLQTQDTSLPIASSIRQIDGLQLLRAVAVILVIWCHAGQVLQDSGSSGLPALNVFGIDIFFVISGFILSLVVLRERRKPGLRPMADFMKRRLLRIYPIYWVVALIMLGRLALSGNLFQSNYIPAFLLLPSLHYPSDRYIMGYSWTLVFEMFFYILLGLTLLKTIKWAVPFLIALLSISVAIGAVIGIRHPVWIIAGNPILLEFVYGASLALLYARIGQRRIAGIVLTVVGVAAAILLQIHNPPSVASGLQMVMLDDGVFLRVATWGVCALVIVSGVVFWSPSMESAFGKAWVILGNASYSTYIVSALCLEFTYRLFFKFVPYPIFPTGIRVVFELSLLTSTLVIGFASYVFVEKPLLRFLQNKFLARTKPRPVAPVSSIPSTSILFRSNKLIPPPILPNEAQRSTPPALSPVITSSPPQRIKLSPSRQ
jgi:exopolysaccharide production protein ExoZ